MPHSTFDNYGLPPKLSQTLTRIKFTTPTPIQAQTIPLALEGKDILGSAQTGTGKTGAFGIPVIAGLMARPDAAALIMTPTRELAGQVLAALEPMIPTVEIRTALLIGGEAMPKQMHQLRHNPRLIVGTPGRINDHLERGSLKLGNVRFLVLDETDRMLDMGFGIQIERILKHVPSDRQTLLFSATLPSNITKLSGKYMRDPVRVAVGSTTSPVAKIKQEVIPVTDHEKYGKLREQLDMRKGSIIIFVKTKYGTEKLADRLTKDEHRADAIHGDLQQRRRERVIQNFRDKKFRILVATDVAARGLDIPHIAHVINYDMPQAPEDYIHRIGRTARAGAEGEAVSFLTGADNVKWRAIQRLLNGEDPNAAPQRSGGARRSFGGGRKPFWKKEGDAPRGDRSSTPRSANGERSFGDRPQTQKKTFGDRSRDHHPRDPSARDERPRDERPRGERPRDERPRGERPRDERPRGERSFGSKPKSDWSPNDRVRGDRYHDDKPRSDKPRGPRGEKTYSDRPRSDRPQGERTVIAKTGGGEKSYPQKKHFSERSPSNKTHDERSHGDRPRGDRPANKSFGGKFGTSKPARGRG